MSHLSTLRSLGLALLAVALPLVVGCGSISQEEMDALEKQRQTTLAAEDKVAELQAEKARLERNLAEQQATKQALEDKRAATKTNLAN